MKYKMHADITCGLIHMVRTTIYKRLG